MKKNATLLSLSHTLSQHLHTHTMTHTDTSDTRTHTHAHAHTHTHTHAHTHTHRLPPPLNRNIRPFIPVSRPPCHSQWQPCPSLCALPALLSEAPCHPKLSTEGSLSCDIRGATQPATAVLHGAIIPPFELPVPVLPPSSNSANNSMEVQLEMKAGKEKKELLPDVAMQSIGDVADCSGSQASSFHPPSAHTRRCAVCAITFCPLLNAFCPLARACRGATCRPLACTWHLSLAPVASSLPKNGAGLDQICTWLYSLP